MAFVDALLAEACLLELLIDVGRGNKEVVALGLAQPAQDVEPASCWNRSARVCVCGGLLISKKKARPLDKKTK
jgi:hypothetical protein